MVRVNFSRRYWLGGLGTERSVFGTSTFRDGANSKEVAEQLDGTLPRPFACITSAFPQCFPIPTGSNNPAAAKKEKLFEQALCWAWSVSKIVGAHLSLLAVCV